MSDIALTGLAGALALLAGCAVSALGILVGLSGWLFSRLAAKTRGLAWVPHVFAPAAALLLNLAGAFGVELFRLPGESKDRVGMAVALSSLGLWVLLIILGSRLVRARAHPEQS